MRTRLLGIAVVAGMLAPLGACSQVFVNNPKRSGLDCSRTPFWPIVDFALVAAGTYFLVDQGTAADEPVTLVAPGVFALSGLWGAVKVGRCRSKWADATPEQIAAFHKEQAEANARWQAQMAADAAAREQAQAEANAAAQANAQAQADADAQARANAEAEAEAYDSQSRTSAPAPAPAPARRAEVVPYQPQTQPTVSVTSEHRPPGVWRTKSRDACSARDWIGKTKLSPQDAHLRSMHMTDVCQRCVAQNKMFVLMEDGGIDTMCD